MVCDLAVGCNNIIMTITVLRRRQFLSLIYADIFEYPLTYEEMSLFAINYPNWKFKQNPEFHTMNDSLGRQMFFLPGKQNLLNKRIANEKNSKEKINLAVKIAAILGRIPFIQAIYLTGSVAVANANKTADIDFMIITSMHRLWLTRLLVVLCLKLHLMYRSRTNISDKICTNLFITENYLAIKEKNLYSAHEILQAKCLFDRDNFEMKWLMTNSWVQKYLPSLYKAKIALVNNKKVNRFINKNKAIFIWKIDIIYIFEIITFLIQYLYMRPKITNEKINLNYAFFHPRTLADKIVDRFEKKLESLI